MNALNPAVITGVGLAVRGLRGVPDLLAPEAAYDGFDLDAEPVARNRRHKDRASRLALRATELALRDAALPEDMLTAVVVSSNFGNLDTVCEFTDTIAEESVTGLSPMRVPHMSGNVTACWLALEHRLRGPNITLCSGTTSGLDAMFWAGALLATGRADTVVVVGVEPDTAPVARLHNELGASAWLDGAVCLVVEPLGQARARGAEPRATISGYGRAADRTAAVREAVRASGNMKPVERPGGHVADPADTLVGHASVASTGVDSTSLDSTGRGRTGPGRTPPDTAAAYAVGLVLGSGADVADALSLAVAAPRSAAVPRPAGTSAAGPSLPTRLSTNASDLIPGPVVVDLTARLGRCSGALGVLQCAAAVAWFDQAGGGAAVAVAGADHAGDRDAGDARADDPHADEADPSGVAALVLTRPDAYPEPRPRQRHEADAAQFHEAQFREDRSREDRSREAQIHTAQIHEAQPSEAFTHGPRTRPAPTRDPQAARLLPTDAATSGADFAESPAGTPARPLESL